MRLRPDSPCGIDGDVVAIRRSRASAPSRTRSGSRTGRRRSAFIVQWQLGLFHYFRAELAAARVVAERLIALAQVASDPGIRLEGRTARWVSRSWTLGGSETRSSTSRV